VRALIVEDEQKLAAPAGRNFIAGRDRVWPDSTATTDASRAA
jgi:hypothetical protein